MRDAAMNGTAYALIEPIPADAVGGADGHPWQPAARHTGHRSDGVVSTGAAKDEIGELRRIVDLDTPPAPPGPAAPPAVEACAAPANAAALSEPAGSAVRSGDNGGPHTAGADWWSLLQDDDPEEHVKVERVPETGIPHDIAIEGARWPNA
ncbi:hypothetical protein [Mycobacterium servetii]|uniref:Uncharacterized protein n=1 Tax=Mycobacterium servetii TaxID=3237418 RepID=A0ABV4C936_9MYCO